MLDYIFHDLDDALCNFIASPSHKRNKIVLSDGDKYYGYVRPMAHQMLKDLREIAPVKMLTTATREYALKVNEIYKFGFAPEDIFAYDDCWTEEQIGYGKDYFAIQQNIAPNSVLIDNLPVTDPWPRRKMHVLGIKEDRYIQIREFNGKDPDKFVDEWAAIVEKATGFK